MQLSRQRKMEKVTCAYAVVLPFDGKALTLPQSETAPTNTCPHPSRDKWYFASLHWPPSSSAGAPWNPGRSQGTPLFRATISSSSLMVISRPFMLYVRVSFSSSSYASTESGTACAHIVLVHEAPDNSHASLYLLPLSSSGGCKTFGGAVGCSTGSTAKEGEPTCL